MKLPGSSPASRTVLVLLVAIAALETGLSGKFGKIWAFAFNPSAAGGTTSNATTSPAAGHPDATDVKQMFQGAERGVH